MASTVGCSRMVFVWMSSVTTGNDSLCLSEDKIERRDQQPSDSLAPPSFTVNHCRMSDAGIFFELRSTLYRKSCCLANFFIIEMFVLTKGCFFCTSPFFLGKIKFVSQKKIITELVILCV